MQTAYVPMAFVKNRDIDFLSAEIKPLGENTLPLTPTSEHLRVITNVGAKGKERVVTLQLSGAGFAT